MEGGPVPLVLSNELDAFATVPHCLDNQFLPRELLSQVYKGKQRLNRGLRARAAAVRREYVRSLLYSPEVIINRAFVLNEPAVYRDVRDHPESVASLINDKRMTILLLGDEPSLSAVMDNPRIEISKDGTKAWRAFLAAYGEVDLRYLKLSSDETEAVTSRFPNFVRALFRLELPDSRMIELFKPVAIDGYTPQRLGEFKAFLDEQRQQWIDTGAQITRTTFYERFIMPRGVDLSKPNIDPAKPYAFELKLLADLAYGHNTPTTLRRQSFIATEMPSPLCLPPDLFSRGSAFGHLNTVTAGDVCDRAMADVGWYYETAEAFLVPDWAELTAEDVQKIQSWPEWINFRTAQQAVADVERPDEFDGRLQELFGALSAFQAKLAHEIDDPSSTLRRVKAGAKILKLVVRPVITWGGQTLGPGLAGLILTEVAQRGVEFAIDVSIDFVDRRHEQHHEQEVERFVSHAEGVRQNVAASIQASSSRMQAVETIAQQPSFIPPDTKSPAQKA
jgi:hypothetical protein